MFLGHYGVALGAKTVAPRVSLGTLILSAQLADLLWPIFLLVGLERVRIEPGLMPANELNFTYYPVTHSLLGALAWSVLAVLIYLTTTRSATDRVGHYALWAMLVVLALFYVSSLTGPPPPNVQALAVLALGGWLFVPWGYWIDRHRRAAGASTASVSTVR